MNTSMQVINSNPIPVSIELRQQSKLLDIGWDNGLKSSIPFDVLRANCACSMCRSNQGKSFLYGALNINVTHAVSMGSSGIQLHFSDGHNRGIFPWGYLLAISEGKAQEYLEDSRLIAKRM